MLGDEWASRTTGLEGRNRDTSPRDSSYKGPEAWGASRCSVDAGVAHCNGYEEEEKEFGHVTSVMTSSQNSQALCLFLSLSAGEWAFPVTKHVIHPVFSLQEDR